jgi:hypothetical protein
MLKLRNRNKTARRVAVPRAPLSPQEVRELLIADSAPLRMSRAAAEYVRRAKPGDKFDVRDRLYEVGREEEACFGCFRPVFVLAAEQPGPMCEQCVEQGRGWFTATLGLAEVRAVDIALGARLQGTADYLMAEVLGCRPVLCGDCGSRFYVYADQPGPHLCAECAEWQTEAAAAAELDRQEAERGRVRVACKWCDGEFYVPAVRPGPHSCSRCDYKDGL